MYTVGRYTSYEYLISLLILRSENKQAYYHIVIKYYYT